VGDESLQKLMDGNKRYVEGKLAGKDLGDNKRKELLKGQKPFAIVITCSDSRVPPELLFDQGLGDIFVIRVAGNKLLIPRDSALNMAQSILILLSCLSSAFKPRSCESDPRGKRKPEGNISEP
jgi:carbonic anhydrase